MLSLGLKQQITKDDLKFKDIKSDDFILPKYNPETHYLELTKSGYFYALIILRHYIKVASDYYFGVECGAKNVDLFMLTPSVSSPMGPGSDSEAIPIKFGKYNSNLIDSSQFGFEPLLLNGIDKVYCYLPSMRGEEPDKRHLNQFFHCEAEIRGSIDNLIPIIEGYIGFLSETLLTMPNILAKISLDPEKTLLILNEIAKSKSQIWETKNPPEIKNDAVRAERVGLTKIILDGQQRLTTLYLLINGEIPPYYKEKDIINDPRHLFFLDISILK